MQDATKRWLDEDEQRVYDDPTNVHPGGNESRLMDIIDRLCADLDKQQEVIDKLPKCWRLDDNGELVQDVPVTLGMNIYVESAGRVVGCGYISMREPDSTCGDIWGTVRTEDGAEFGVPVYLTYATKEAAAARAGEGRG